jgi:ABC-type antimicrobial peptide transport system permease subunit
MVVIVTLAAVAGVVAAVGPARRAAKLDILDAIASH